MIAPLVLGLLALLVSPQEGFDRGSPFEALRWVGDRPEVRLGETWYRPVSIAGVAVDDILEFCDRRWPGQRRKRFGEDLIEAMTRLGSQPPAKVELELVRLSDDASVKLSDVEMSARNRQAIRRDSQRQEAEERARPTAPRTLRRDQARADLEEFCRRLEDQFAYLRWKGIDLREAAGEIASRFGDTVETEAFADELDRLLLRFGDGHAGVRSPVQESESRFPPVLLVEADGGVAAIRADRSDFVDPERPYVVRIDGRSIEAWIEALRPWIVDGSPQIVRTRALRALREIVDWRRKLGAPRSDEVRYELARRPGDRKAEERIVPLQDRRPVYGSWPRGGHRELPGRVGYLRLDRMDDDEVPALRRAMVEFADTQGLIVDVRGNGGGSRGLLLALAGYLGGEDDEPWVGNAAVYRASDRFDRDHLEARFMRRADDPRWTARQREAIDRFAAAFEPEWDPGEGFSDWHYLVLDRTGDPLEHPYERPVVVLCDADGFSATDIFLGALKGHPQVTLMGAASGGGSARSQEFTLPHSRIAVRCASMASFRPDGRLYDGRGIEVDVDVQPAAGDFLEGGGDRVLEAARRRLRVR